MTPAEEKAFHRGRNAAQLDARKINPGERTHCPYSTPALRQKWDAGYAEQEAASRPPLTPEQQANLTKFVGAIQGWLERTK